MNLWWSFWDWGHNQMMWFWKYCHTTSDLSFLYLYWCVDFLIVEFFVELAPIWKLKKKWVFATSYIVVACQVQSRQLNQLKSRVMWHLCDACVLFTGKQKIYLSNCVKHLFYHLNRATIHVYKKSNQAIAKWKLWSSTLNHYLHCQQNGIQDKIISH